MAFSSVQFLFVFLPLSLAVYWLCPKWLRNAMLAAFSLLFFAWAGLKGAAILVLLAGINWLGGLSLGRLAHKRPLLILLILLDLAVLGHIHRPQNVRGPRIRYCGAPLQYAKDEAGQARGATLVEMDAAGAITVQAVPLRPLHPVWQIRGRLEALLAPGFGPGQQAQDYFFVTLTDETPPAAPMDRLRAKYPNVLGLELDRDAGGVAGQAQHNAAADVAGKTLQALFGEFFENRNGRPMNGVEAAALAAVLEKRREEAPQ